MNKEEELEKSEVEARNRFLDRDDDFHFQKLLTVGVILRLTSVEADRLRNFFDRESINVVYQTTTDGILKIIHLRRGEQDE